MRELTGGPKGAHRELKIIEDEARFVAFTREKAVHPFK